MKKSLSAILAVFLMLTAAACGTNKSTDSKNDSSTASKIQAENSAVSSGADVSSESSGASTTDGKAIVVYFSATGSTKAVAEVIAENKNAELYELQPEKPYTDDDLDYNNEKSRVSKEHNDASRSVPLKNGKVPDFDSYTTVYLGYPIWWGEAAWPVETFVKQNDLNGKTVIPFCTSASSGMGDSANQLKALSNGGTWKEGQRFSSGVDTATVIDWLNQN